MLPSKIMTEANTLDVYVINTATAWEQYQSEKAQAKSGKGTLPVPKISQERLKEMLDRVNKKKK
jgi:hypothetical protein